MLIMGHRLRSHLAAIILAFDSQRPGQARRWFAYFWLRLPHKLAAFKQSPGWAGLLIVMLSDK
jgi:hypothetical protein